MNFPGWKLIDLNYKPNDGGSWLLHFNGEAMLLEIPWDLTVAHVRSALSELGLKLKYVTVSHQHGDHADTNTWLELEEEFPNAQFLWPYYEENSYLHYDLAGEPVWIIQAPKHSCADAIVIFRGLAMTGDVELGTLESCNDEVSLEDKAESMEFFACFEYETIYEVHSIVSAHLNDIRTNINWSSLFKTKC